MVFAPCTSRVEAGAWLFFLLWIVFASDDFKEDAIASLRSPAVALWRRHATQAGSYPKVVCARAGRWAVRARGLLQSKRLAARPSIAREDVR